MWMLIAIVVAIGLLIEFERRLWWIAWDQVGGDWDGGDFIFEENFSVWLILNALLAMHVLAPVAIGAWLIWRQLRRRNVGS
jgi:hypothetical protein